MTGMVIGEAVSRCLYWPVTRPARIHTGADADSDEPCAPTGSDNPLPQEQESKVEVGQEPQVDAGAEDDCPAYPPDLDIAGCHSCSSGARRAQPQRLLQHLHRVRQLRNIVGRQCLFGEPSDLRGDAMLNLQMAPQLPRCICESRSGGCRERQTRRRSARRRCPCRTSVSG